MTMTELLEKKLEEIVEHKADIIQKNLKINFDIHNAYKKLVPVLKNISNNIRYHSIDELNVAEQLITYFKNKYGADEKLFELKMPSKFDFSNLFLLGKVAEYCIAYAAFETMFKENKIQEADLPDVAIAYYDALISNKNQGMQLTKKQLKGSIKSVSFKDFFKAYKDKYGSEYSLDMLNSLSESKFGSFESISDILCSEDLTKEYSYVKKEYRKAKYTPLALTAASIPFFLMSPMVGFFLFAYSLCRSRSAQGRKEIYFNLMQFIKHYKDKEKL